MTNYIISLKNQEGFKACCQMLKKKKRRFKYGKSLNIITVNAVSTQELSNLISIHEIDRVVKDVSVSIIPDQMITTSKSAQSVLPWGMKRMGSVYKKIPKQYSRPRVAVLDTGLSRHPALRIQKSYANFSADKTAVDKSGHGTHLAGTIAGYSSKAFHGIFPALSLYSVKAFNHEGSAQLSDIILAIDWCIQKRIQIINMSFGLEQHEDLLYDAIKKAHAKGILLIAASGNNGRPQVLFPAQYPEVIAVGSIDKNDQISSFSQYGNSLDVVAPGEEIYSAWIGKSYQTVSGTSMACAHVTGAASLILAVKPSYKSNQVKEMLLSTTEELNASYLKQGKGLVSVTNIVKKLQQ